MPRIPYLQDDQVGPPELVAAIRRRRGGELLELDRMLLYSPPVAEGWNQMMGRVRGDLKLDARLRELAMCTVAALNGADYEMHHHAPLYLAAGGTREQLALIETLRGTPDALTTLRASGFFDAPTMAALALIVQSTCQVNVDDAVFDAARSAMADDRLLFELVAVVAAYNMVSRVLVAFGVTPHT